VPLWGIAVFFIYYMRRVNCLRCGVRTEKVPWGDGKKHLTHTYCWFLAIWAKRMSWKAVAEAFHTSWENVFRSVKMAVAWGRQHVELSGVAAIGVDEIQWKHGQKYLTLVYQIDEGRKRLLWMGRERTEATLQRFFLWFGQARSAALTFVASDMWKPYLKVIARMASQAVHVLDRFHVMAHLSKAIDKVRADEARGLRAKGLHPVLKDSRWVFLKRPENLTDKQELKLADLLRYNLRTVRSYLLKEHFQDFWNYVSPFWAGRFLDRWSTQVMRSRIEPMKKVARMLRSHRALIVNWFRAKGAVSCGSVEGLNTKARITTRRAFGFRTYEAIEIALYHTLGDLPAPKFTHRFC
jgi:transposase